MMGPTNSNPTIPRSPESLFDFVQNRLHRCQTKPIAFSVNGDLRKISAVLFLLTADWKGEPFLILNKRSRCVRQPGDLCCPGGGISPYKDFLLARLLGFPGSPLYRWPYRKWWVRHRTEDLSKLSLIVATALREGLEEMRLNPFGVRFLGPMPVQHLILHKREIYPLVGWVNRQKRFYPNWEVDQIVHVPLRSFFDTRNYVRFHLDLFGSGDNREFPGFIHRHNARDELLWGATYRITVQFMETVFGYRPPPVKTMPAVDHPLDNSYFS